MRKKSGLSVLVLLITLLLITFVPVQGQYTAEQHTSKDGKYSWITYKGDPMGVREYRLNNGLTVFLSVNKDAPRIHTRIAVRAGSKNDPADATGLAHYLEHMLFKGTDKFGTQDYQEEKKYLDKIESLYETYRQTREPAARKALYRQIDSISGIAAELAIANEYDKLMAALGATGTNAYTSNERTVYLNDIPANQLEKWLEIESERFRNPVMRLFHTELEAVYEEKNISLDSDQNLVAETMMMGLFPHHNYGLQTTIGTVEHLKNPSITKIREYYRTHYVPNNMAIMMSGDLDPDKTIRLIDQYFGYFESRKLKPYIPGEERGPVEPQMHEIIGPESEMVSIAFRFPGVRSRDSKVMFMIDYLLSNSQAGMIDLNLVQSQRVLDAWSYTRRLKDYSIQFLGGMAREGQSLEEVEVLLLEQLNMIREGEFQDPLLESIIHNLKIDQIRGYRANGARTGACEEAFITGQTLSEYLSFLDDLSTITKEEIMEVAGKYLMENRVSVFKRTGEREPREKVIKPEITPVKVNREATSEFASAVLKKSSPDIDPEFLNFKERVEVSKLYEGIPFHYVKNEEDELFDLVYVFDFGKMHDKELAFALDYLDYLGTERYSSEGLKRALYELGAEFSIYSAKDKIYISISGLDTYLFNYIELLEHILSSAKADPEALQKMVEGELKSREDSKKEKFTILQSGMLNYGKYGSRNPFTDRLSEEELKALDPEALVRKIKQLSGYEHRILYYGPRKSKEVIQILNKNHKTPPPPLKPAPVTEPYQVQQPTQPKVYFVNYDMVQAEVIWLAPDVSYDSTLIPQARLFNTYYGGTMASIVFQTLRESKALAYSTYAGFLEPDKAEGPFFTLAYIGTQADKLKDALEGMDELLQEMPKSAELYENSKAAMLRQLQSKRITRDDILFAYEAALSKGLNRDIRAKVFEALPDLSLEKLAAFHAKHISNKPYQLLVLGSRDKIDFEALKKYGEVVELSLEEIFGF